MWGNKRRRKSDKKSRTNMKYYVRASRGPEKIVEGTLQRKHLILPSAIEETYQQILLRVETEGGQSQEA